MHISVSKIGTRLKTKRRSSTSSNGSTKSSKAQKPQRVYLKEEPHDYFNIRYVLKMQERQRQLAKEGKRLPAHPSLSENDDDDNDSNASSNSDSNKIVPSTKWRAYDLHNKPRSLYSEEDKKLAAAQKNLYQSPLAVTVHRVPLKHIIAAKLKNYCNRLIGYKKQHAEMGVGRKNTDFKSSTKSVDMTEGRRGLSADRSSPVLQQQTTPVTDQGSLKRKVHFSPETIFCERNEKSKFWLSFLEKKRERALRKAEEEEACRPRPFLPYLEAGLSYRSDEEFYELKNRFRSSSMSEGVQRSKPQSNWKNIANLFHKKPTAVEAVRGAGGSRRKSLF